MATLTVGSGQTYSTFAAANSAAEAGDIIHIYTNAEGNNIYQAANITKAITVIGIVRPLFVGAATTEYTISSATVKNCAYLLNNRAAYTNGMTISTGAIVDGCVFDAAYVQYAHGVRVTDATLCNSIIRYFANTAGVYGFRCTSADSKIYNNVIAVMNTAGAGIYAGGSAYNNIFLGTLTGSFSYENYNLHIGGLFGDHDQLIIEMASAGLTSDLRTVFTSEVAGTLTANGVDLSTIFTTDIDGRARPATAAGYARGCSYGFFGNGIPDFAAAGNVLVGDTTNGVDGTLTLPTAGELKAGVVCGASGTSLTGTRTDAPEEDVRLGVDYGADGTEFEGELDIEADAPATPTLTVVDDGDETATATISGADTGTTNTVYYAEFGTDTWLEAGAVVGNGTVALDLGAGAFSLQVQSKLGAGCSSTTPMLFRIKPADGEAAIITAAEDIKNALIGGSFSQEFTPERTFIKDLRTEKIPSGVSIWINPIATEMTSAARSKKDNQLHEIEVCLCKKTATDAEKDELAKLLEELYEFLRHRALTGGRKVESIEIPELYSTEWMVERGLYVSSLVVQVREIA